MPLSESPQNVLPNSLREALEQVTKEKHFEDMLSFFSKHHAELEDLYDEYRQGKTAPEQLYRRLKMLHQSSLGTLGFWVFDQRQADPRLPALALYLLTGPGYFDIRGSLVTTGDIWTFMVALERDVSPDDTYFTKLIDGIQRRKLVPFEQSERSIEATNNPAPRIRDDVLRSIDQIDMALDEEAPSEFITGLDPEKRQRFQALEEKLRNKGVLDDLKRLKQWPPKEHFKPQQGPEIFYPESPFVFRSRRDSDRSMMVVYVDNGKEIKTRLIYSSTSHIVLKTLFRILTSEGHMKLFDKAESEDSLTLASPYQAHLLQLLSTKNHVSLPMAEDRKDDRFFMNLVESKEEEELYDEDKSAHTFLGNIERGTQVLSPSISEPEEDPFVSENDSFFHPEALHLEDADQSKDPDTAPDEYLPTRYHGYLEMDHDKYGPVEAHLFESIHEEHPLRYLVFRAKDPINPSKKVVWIGAIEGVKKENTINEHLVRRRYKHLPQITMPLLEKPKNIQKFSGGTDYDDPWMSKFQCPHTSSGDLVTTPYLEKIPIIRAFTAKLRDIDEENILSGGA